MVGCQTSLLLESTVPVDVQDPGSTRARKEEHGDGEDKRGQLLH